MGGSPSKTRKFTVENDDPTSVIKVSEDVVERIKGRQTQIAEPAPSLSNPGLPGHFGPQIVSPQPIYMYDPSLTTLQLRQANVAELKKNDEYWQERLVNMEKNQKKVNEILDYEYKKALEEYKGKTDSPAVKFQPPCQDSKKAVVECYRQYPNEPMRCAKIVQAFQECVDIKRSNLIANKS